MRTTVIGAGYVGLTTGLTLAYTGHEVTCVDIDADKIAQLDRGQLPIYEPFALEMLGLVRDRVTFTCDLAAAIGRAEVIFVAVNTPSGDDGRADLRYVRSAAESIGRHLSGEFVVVVNKSTVPLGSASLVENLIRHSYARHQGGKLNGRAGVVSNPEFLREGSALSDSLYPDRVVIGANDDRAMGVMRALYEPLLRQTFVPPPFLPRPATTNVELLQTSVVSAEMIKYAANTFLATKVSFANELALLAERSGADIADVSHGIGLDHRIGPAFLSAGLGWGGSCFGKDTAALAATARDYGICMPITEATRAVNTRQREAVVGKLQHELKILQGRTIGLLGLSFKPHTDDIRDAPALDVARRLVGMGVQVRAHDPCALERARREIPHGVEFCDSPQQMAEDADALFLATEWPDYARLPWEDLARRMRTPVMLDGRNFLNRTTLQQAGFRYVGVGR